MIRDLKETAKNAPSIVSEINFGSDFVIANATSPTIERRNQNMLLIMASEASLLYVATLFLARRAILSISMLSRRRISVEIR